ncbi:glycosyltransferase family 2 protein [Clostridium sp. OM02-18AC]|uniref:glycosyltransferase family 2 protein n=1 Tax=Clostridium sp. OM02-18AC TaxID=2292311 RepID=UPI000E4A170B|nr:glycosyltransferase family 2 protein [Clostridium sp. OM02-18AC]RHV63243.1 glycosyltransferase family 2 protein [Clostridium sp. OM02-18AC]
MNKILLFIPMYNCEKQIIRVLEQLNDEVCKYLTEAVIINNRSTDHGEEVVENYLIKHTLPLKVSLLRNDENYGLGGSHKVAFQYAIDNNFDYIIVLHGDDQGDISNVLPYLQRGEFEKYECFLGARFMKGSKLQGYSRFRTFGNIIYNFLFSIGCRYKVYDLGSGLNMYKVDILKDKFYIKYKDNLMFNYCMILGSAYYKHKVKFFPIVWREDDQVSNVKMVNQAITVLKLLGAYILNKDKFIRAEHREVLIKNYSAQTIYTNIQR